MADLAAYGSRHTVVSLSHDPKGVTVDWSDGHTSRFHVLWLRDNCACPECRHPQALERTYRFIDHDAPQKQYDVAGLNARHIVSQALAALGVSEAVART